MRYCFIISNARLDYFNIEKVKKEISDTRFVLIYQERSKNNPSEHFISNMDHVFALKQITFELAKEVIDKFIKVNFNATIICTDETLLIVCARLRAKFKLNGPKPYQYFHFIDKVQMKQILQINNIKVPKFMSVVFSYAENSIREYHQFISSQLKTPYLIKPCDGGASENTAKINNAKDLIHWYRTNYDSKQNYQVEEFIEGSFFMCDSFVVNGCVKFSTIAQYISPCLEFLQGKTLGAFPMKKENVLYNKILEFNNKVISALQPPDGALHMEFFIKNDEIIFIEIGARPPGKAAVLIHERNFGINLYELTLRHGLGLTNNYNINQNLYHAWANLACHIGKVNTLNIPNLKSKFEIIWKIQVGDVIDKHPSSINEGIAADIVLFNPNFEEFMQDIELLKDFKSYS